ncbi:hypothetical protein K488DRAFT_52221 [Vararia minispora EC-137]|uniref:Uncharacterized protein n=1 Tax=Vararia minispora EC-137 TaxID=1314806 RepID=A0ACB8QHR2_9AGAM|nr:hypothetical protein K488DRAFT_52221 [Vararia minispora EC-137]
MTSITRNFPWFVRDLGISIVGKKCYVSLVEDLDIFDVECVKYAASKGIGLGIVVGGSIMKVPQLLLILRSNSARGLSLPAYILETLAYAITTVYSWRNAYAFSTYGENFFLTLQNVVITFLIVAYAVQRPKQALSAPPPSPANALALLALLQLLQLSTLPLSLFSKLPQIAQNQRARSTGQLSAFAVGAQIAGCAARLFTNAAEVGDAIQAAGFLLALILNLVLGVQMAAFWGRDAEPARSALQEKADFPLRDEREQDFDIVVPPQSPATHQTSHNAQPTMPGRRWARKVD